jgi:hypothetical protein
MADLAPFVASILRDVVVDELQEENRQLRARLSTSIRSSRTISISGVNGEIYAEGHLDDDGHPREGDAEQVYWQVDLMPRALQCSSMEQLRAIEICIGDIRKSGLECDDTDERCGWFPYYDPDISEADITLELGGGSIIFAHIGPISEEDFDALPPESDLHNIFDVFSDVFSEKGEVTVTLVRARSALSRLFFSCGTLHFCFIRLSVAGRVNRNSLSFSFFALFFFFFSVYTHGLQEETKTPTILCALLCHAFYVTLFFLRFPFLFAGSLGRTWVYPELQDWLLRCFPSPIFSNFSQ